MKWRALAACTVLLAACGFTADQVARNVYEGARIHNENIRSATGNPAPHDGQSYDQYDAERRRLGIRKREQ